MWGSTSTSSVRRRLLFFPLISVLRYLHALSLTHTRTHTIATNWHFRTCSYTEKPGNQMLSGPQTYKVKHYHTHTHIEKKPCAQEPCTHTHTNTKACSGVFWPRQALRPAWLFYHSFPQKCFSSSFSPWKTEFMTRHLFC